MADFTKYELEKLKQQKKAETQKDLKAKKMFRLKLIGFLILMGIAIFVIYKLVDKGENKLDESMKQETIKSKEYE